MRLPRLQHVSVAVFPDSQETVRTFYGRLLGLEEKPVPTSLAGTGIIWFMVGDGEMELHLVPDSIAPNPEAAGHFCLEVEDLEDYRSRLESAGYPIIETTPIHNRPRFFSLDPFGNRLEFTTILGDYQESP